MHPEIPTPRPALPPPHTSGASLRILLVDDDELDRLAVRRCLQRTSVLVRVDEAATAAETRERIATATYDCILLDYYIPGVEGLALLRALREATPETPVVIFTGRGDEEVAVELMKSGAADYLPKASLSPERLAASLRYALELFEARAARRRAEEALHEQREWLRVTLTSIGDGVIATDASGDVTFLNPVAQELTGWKPQEAAGQPLTKVFHIVNEQTRELVDNPALRAMKEGLILGLANHTILIAKDGTERAIDDSGAPLRDAGGKIIGAVLIFRDITEKRRLQREKDERAAAARLLAAVVESSEDAIVSQLLDGMIQSWNRAAEQLFGRPAQEVVGRPIQAFIPSDLADEEERALARARAGERVTSFDTLRVRADGRLVPVGLTISPIRDEEGQIVGVSRIARDITARKQAEEALRDSEERFRAIVSQTIVGVAQTDLTGRFTFVNPRYCEITGYSGDELQQRRMQDITQPEDLPGNSERFRRMIEGGGPSFVIEKRYVRPDGSVVWVSNSVSLLRDDRGKPTGAVAMSVDITDQKRAENLLRLLSEAAQHLLTAGDRDELVRGLFEKIKGPLGVDAYFNYAVNDAGDALRLLSCGGIPEEMARSIRCLDIGTAVCGTAAAQRQAIHATYIQQSDEPMVQLAKSFGIRAYACHPLLAEYRLIGTLSFASRSKDEFAPDELDFLRTVSHYVTAAYERLRHIGQLREADRRKDEFLATLAHELRNPLAPIRNMLELMKRADTGDEVLRQARDTMDRQLSQVVHLVNDLLDLSRITRDKLELRREDVQLASVVSQAVEVARPLADCASHELTVELPPEPITLHADPVRLAQVFSNLLTNACKYTNSGGRIRLTIERQGSDVLVKVKDTGIGISPDQLGSVFDIFSQVQSARERSQGGLGIGLALVKRLAEMHDGSVEAHSEGLGRGSEFVVRLPVLLTEPQVRTPASPGEPTHVAGRRILVVDDNRDSAESLAVLLQASGNTTGTAHDGLEAVEAAEQFRPEVMLMDIGLPRLNGYDACRRIRQQPWGQDILMVAMTGWGQDEDRRRSKEAGFDHHVVKPIDFSVLMNLLDESPVTAS